MLRPAMLLLAVATLVTSVSAQEDPIARRRAIYKGWAAASREPGQMLRGNAPFELAKVQAALKTFQSGTGELVNLFPESSKTGGDTGALPIIWEDKAKFNALFVKFGQDSATAETTIKDEASFKAEFPKLLAQCGACHNTFRVKQ